MFTENTAAMMDVLRDIMDMDGFEIKKAPGSDISYIHISGEKNLTILAQNGAKFQGYKDFLDEVRER